MISINGKNHILKKILVHAKKDLILPYKGYIEIHGQDLQTKETVNEMIKFSLSNFSN